MAVAAKPIVTVFVHRSREPMMARLAVAIGQRHDDALDRAELEEEPTQPGIEIEHRAPEGLEPCDACNVSVARRGDHRDHYQVHFPNGETSTPCPRSWPLTPGKKS